MKIFNAEISKKTLYLLVFLTISQNLNSQVVINDTVATKPAKILIKQTIIPITFIGAGLLLNNSQFEQNIQHEISNPSDFKIDDYAQFVPIIELYIADIVGVKSKNHWFDQTKYLSLSIFISSGVTYGINHLTQKTGPDGAPLSFPSGHTTFAFTNATVLFNEFQQTSPLLAYSGYLFATTTGTFRVINNEHWISDVLLGAGIGMLSAHLVYYFEPLKKFNPCKKSKNITVTPTLYNNEVGLYFSYRFK